MNNSQALKRKKGSVYNLYAHIVFVTKYRKKVLNKLLLNRIETIFKEILQQEHSQLVEFSGESDHIHALIPGCQDRCRL